MTKFANTVRFKVKPGKVDGFLKAFESMHGFDGVEFQRLIQTGDLDFATYSEWESEGKLAAARPAMIAFLDTIRDYLGEISPELGVTDPVSGPVILSRRADPRLDKLVRFAAPAGRETVSCQCPW